jgi:hypothetical protein
MERIFSSFSKSGYENVVLADVGAGSAVFSREFQKRQKDIKVFAIDSAYSENERSMSTEDFKFVEGQYIDLDNAISEIVNKYYKSLGEKNPFIDDIDEDALKDFEAGLVPREAVIVEEGKQKGKGIAKPAPEVKDKKSKSKEVVEVEMLSEKGMKFKNELANQKEFLYDDVDDTEKEDYKSSIQEKLEANELMADDGDEDFVERVKILKDFIKSLK